MAEMARIIDWDVLHVSEVEELLSGDEAIEGHCHASDPEIAAWCAARGRILVAIDDDHKGGAQRAGVMNSNGVEMIWIKYDPKGLDEHVAATVSRLPVWNRILTGQKRAPRVWAQGRRGELSLHSGTKSRARRGKSIQG